MNQTNEEYLNRNQQRVSKCVNTCFVLGVVILLICCQEETCLEIYLRCQNQQWLPAKNSQNWHNLDLMQRFEVENVGTRYHWLFWT